MASIYKFIRKGFVEVNGRRVRDPSAELVIGDKITLLVEGDLEHLKRLDESRELVPSDIPLSILFEDRSILVVDKPPGLAMHPGKGVQVVTLIEGLLSYGNSKGFKPRLVHRLDKHTSGIVLVAKTPLSARNLTESFRKREVTKRYISLVKGTSISEKGTLQDVADGTEEKLSFKVVKRYSDCSLIAVHLLTGRKHQIRRQTADRGFPVVGDNVYGDRNFNRRFRENFGLRRYFLHCEQITVNHPVTGEKLSLSSPLPQDLQNVLEHLQ